MRGPLKYDLIYTTEYELYVKMIEIANIVKDWGLTKYQIDILTFYLIYGYSTETKKLILEHTTIKSIDSLNTQNYQISKKGILVPDKRNKNNKNLSYELNDIKEFVKEKVKGLFIEVREK